MHLELDFDTYEDKLSPFIPNMYVPPSQFVMDLGRVLTILDPPGAMRSIQHLRLPRALFRMVRQLHTWLGDSIIIELSIIQIGNQVLPFTLPVQYDGKATKISRFLQTLLPRETFVMAILAVQTSSDSGHPHDVSEGPPHSRATDARDDGRRGPTSASGGPTIRPASSSGPAGPPVRISFGLVDSGRDCRRPFLGASQDEAERAEKRLWPWGPPGLFFRA